MKAIICDRCDRREPSPDQIYGNPPPGWVTVRVHDPERPIGEQHFCSAKCAIEDLRALSLPDAWKPFVKEAMDA